MQHSLDKQVAKVLGYKYTIHKGKVIMDGIFDSVFDFCPSTNWNQGGPLMTEYGIGLIECNYREGISCDTYWLGLWSHRLGSNHYAQQEEGEIAIMKALVASKEE